MTAPSRDNFPELTKVKMADSVECTTSIRKFLHNIKNILDDVQNDRLAISYGGSSIGLKSVDINRIIIDVKCEDKESLLVRNILIEALSMCDHKAPGHELILVHTFIIHLQKLLRTYRGTHKTDGSEALDEALSALSYRTMESNLKELNDLMACLIDDPMTCSLINEAVTLAGSSGQVYVEKTHSNQTCVELTTGYHFKFSMVPEFIVSTGIDRFKRKNTRCIVIDGMIERVSEIDHILQFGHTSMEPIVLFCRGFSEEVVATLSTNFSRKMLDVVPVLVGFDALGANMLNDIAVVTQADMISSLKGDMISNITVEDSPCIDEIIVDRKGTIIINDSSMHDVRIHSYNLIKDRYQIDIALVGGEEKIKILNSRLADLNSRCAHIRFGKDVGSYSGIYVDRISTGIKLFRDVCTTGIIMVDDVISTCEQNKDNIQIFGSIYDVAQKLKKKNVNIIGAKGFIESIRLGITCATSVDSISAYVTSDQ